MTAAQLAQAKRTGLVATERKCMDVYIVLAGIIFV